MLLYLGIFHVSPSQKCESCLSHRSPFPRQALHLPTSARPCQPFLQGGTRSFTNGQGGSTMHTSSVSWL